MLDLILVSNLKVTAVSKLVCAILTLMGRIVESVSLDEACTLGAIRKTTRIHKISTTITIDLILKLHENRRKNHTCIITQFMTSYV